MSIGSYNYLTPCLLFKNLAAKGDHSGLGKFQCVFHLGLCDNREKSILKTPDCTLQH